MGQGDGRRWGMEVLQHPSVRLLGVAVAVGIAVRQLFFCIAEWVWKFDVPLPDADVLPWARWATHERDGAEPYALIVLTMLQLVATGVAYLVVTRAVPRWGGALAAFFLLAPAMFAYTLPPRPPLAAVDNNLKHAMMVVAGSLLIAWLFARSVGPSARVPGLPAGLLLPVCFL